MTPILHDVLIIGGGPAGLSAATGLARQLYTAVVFDSGVYRNARAKHMHNVPTWDHRDPADVSSKPPFRSSFHHAYPPTTLTPLPFLAHSHVQFRASARSDLLTRYSTITFSQTTISSIVRTPSGHFSATDSTGQSWTGKKLLLAVGMRDVHPDSIEGYDSVWGRGVYHCLFCDGYEDRGAESVGVLAVGEMGKVGAAVHVVRMARRLAGRVVVYTEGVEELERGLGEVFGGDGGVVVDGRRVVRLEKVEEGTEKVLVRLEDGTEVKHGFVVSFERCPFFVLCGRRRLTRRLMVLGSQAGESSQRPVC